MTGMDRPDVGFAVLGTLEATLDGVPVALPVGRRRAVLAALLLHRGHPISVDALIDAAWGESVPVDPLAALYTVVSRVRALVGEGALETAPGGYLLAVPRGRLDAERFEELRHRAATAEAGQASRLLDEALALWRGDAYQEFNDRDFARAEALRLDALRLDTIEDRAAIDLELGFPDAASARLGHLVGEHPFRERAWGLLMTALYRGGRTPEALDAYVAYRTSLAAELGLDPSPYLASLHARILGNTGTVATGNAGRAIRWAMPGQTTSFTGRVEETARLVGLVGAHHLVSVVGPGGVGKTRLVMEALAALGRRTGLAPVVVELASAVPPNPGPEAAGEQEDVAGSHRSADVVAAVCEALGMEPHPSRGLASIAEALRAAPGLLVLDNCEHVREQVKAVADALARACPDSVLLLTSRARVGASHEQVLELAPLAVPADGAGHGEIVTADAVRLFLARADAVQPDLRTEDSTGALLAELVRRLDGLPLAIELAARRAAALGLRELVERLEGGLDLVSATGDGRQDSLRRVLDVSWELLRPSGRELLEWLSVFRGEFDLAAAEALRPGPSVTADLDLAELVESSMLTVIRDGSGTRYRLLETVRTYAAEKLSAAHGRDAAGAAHAQWAAALVGMHADAAAGAGGLGSYAKLERARGEFAAAVRFALDTGRCELAAAITGQLALVPHWRPGPRLWQLCAEVAREPGLRGSTAEPLALAAAAMAAAEQGAQAEARQMATRALELAATTPQKYLAGLTLGIAALYAGELSQAASHFAASQEIPGLSEGNRVELHASLALVHCYAGERPAAETSAAAARTAAEGAVPAAVRAFATYASGEALAARDPAAAIAVFREAALKADQIGAQQVGLVARIAWLSALSRSGEYRRALAMAKPLLEGQLKAGNWPQLWTTLRTLAGAYAATGRPALAEFLLAAGDAAPSAPALTGPDALRYLELRQGLRERLGDARAARLAALARSLPRSQVVDRAWAALHLTGASGPTVR